MRRAVSKGFKHSRNGLSWYADNDLWFILPALIAVVGYMMWTRGYFWP